MSFTPLTTSRSLVYTSPSSPYDDIQDLRVEMSNNLESIEIKMERQWDMMMVQFRTQAEQMTTQLQRLSVQLTNTPRPLTPSHLQSPPGPQPETIYEDDDQSSISVTSSTADNTAWLNSGRPMPHRMPSVPTVSPAAAPVPSAPAPAPSLAYAPVAAPAPGPNRSYGPRHDTSVPPPPAPSRALFGGGNGGTGGSYGPRRTKRYLSGYYWEPGLPPEYNIGVSWLEVSLHGPYDGKSDKLQKSPLTLADDSLTGFIQFYNVLRANLHSSGYHMHLLPDLPSVRANTDLSLTPILEHDLLSIGADRSEYTPDATYWQRFHDSFGMILYAVLSNAVKPSAPRVHQIVKNALHMGVSNGFKVMHEILQQHHPKVANSLAPAYETIIGRAPKMKAPKADETYEQVQANYVASFREWETTISLYPEAAQSKPSQRMLAALRGVLPLLRPYVMLLENSVIRHQNKHRFDIPEPTLPRSFDLAELFSVLKAAVQSHDSMRSLPGTHHPLDSRRVAGIDGHDCRSSRSSAPSQDFAETIYDAALHDFYAYCEADNTDAYAVDACVSAIQRYSDSRGGNRTRSSRLPPEPCKHAPCSRTHPPNECCICRAAHPITRCWHVQGLPEGLQSTLSNFKKLCKAQEGPWSPRDRTVAALKILPRSALDLNKSVQDATEDAVDTVLHDAIEAYRSPWLANVLQDKDKPTVSAITFSSTLFHLPHDDALPAEIVARIDDDPVTGVNPVIHAYLHVDTGATCFVTNQQNELHCPVPTNATCGTAQAGPRTTINALGTLVLDLVTSEGTTIPIEAHQTPEIQSFQRRSMSAHALQEFGFDVEHSLISTGNVLRIRQVGTKRWHTIPLTTVGKADFIKVRLHRPSVDGITDFTGPHQALTAQSVARIDLTTKLKGIPLLNLVHLRHGCPGRKITEQLVQCFDSTFRIPPEWSCAICMSEKTKSIPRSPSVCTLLLPIGARLQMDFGFYKIPSIRGFTSFLAVVEAKTSYRWCFLRRTKHPPINLCAWFIQHARKVFGFTVAVIRTDGGGELWGSHAWRNRLIEECHVLIEPTGKENSAANGKSERSIGVLGVQAQLLLCMSALDLIFWCFAILHGCLLLNLRPRADGRLCPFSEIFGVDAMANAIRIFGSLVYQVDRRYTRRRPDSATRKGIWLGLHGTPQICVFMDQLTKRFNYGHHYIVDEFDLHKLPCDRSPAARMLAGDPIPADAADNIREDLTLLEPDISPWLSDSLVNFHIPHDPPGKTFGFVLHPHPGFGRLRIISLIPGSYAHEYLQHKNLSGTFILAINGISIRSITEIAYILDDVDRRSDTTTHARITGFTFLFGRLTSADIIPDILDLQAADHASLRSVFSLCLDLHSLDPTMNPDLTDELLHLPLYQCADFDPEFIAELFSIIKLPQLCPSSFAAALRDPVTRGKWVAGFFKHLDNCYSISTFGRPQVPPPDATVLPAVVALKLVLNQLKQAAAHKVRICVHGGFQIQGHDYERSYAHTVLASTLKIMIAVGACLNFEFFHFDIANAFQSTPDPGDLNGNKTWLKINSTWIDYIRERKPEWWDEVSELLKTHAIEDLAVPMNSFVQGRVDASFRWQEHVEPVIFNDLAFLPNRADPSVYCGLFQQTPVVLCRATDDFLCLCANEETYHLIVKVFEKHWTVHSLGVVSTFFGLHFVVSDDCVTIDQTDKAENIITAVYGPSWIKQPPSSSCSTPMRPGTAYSESLARAIPLDERELKATENEFGFKYRTILQGCMHIALWTRLDILPTCVALAQYQMHTAPVHFAAMKHLVGYLRLHPDLPLVYDRTRFRQSVNSIEIEIDPHVAFSPGFYGPEAYHIGSVDLLPLTHPLYIGSVTFATESPIVHVPAHLPAKYRTPDLPADDVAFKPGLDSTTSFGPSSEAPYTESYVDANLPGGIFEKTPYVGFAISMSGTCVFTHCRKADTPAENTTEAEMDAANQLGRALRWMHLLMEDIGLPFDGPVPVAEDNSATRIIAHTGKITRNVRHIALKTLSLQALVRERIALFRAVGSAQNKADHFTKALPLPAFRDHCPYLMGLRFITAKHAAVVAKRRQSPPV